jgi:hypothetical protein
VLGAGAGALAFRGGTAFGAGATVSGAGAGVAAAKEQENKKESVGKTRLMWVIFWTMGETRIRLSGNTRNCQAGLGAVA